MIAFTQSLLALITVLATVALTFLLIFFPAPESDVFKMLVGGLLTVGFATVYGFFFGSSSESKAKDERVDSAMKALGAMPPAPPPTARVKFFQPERPPPNA